MPSVACPLGDRIGAPNALSVCSTAAWRAPTVFAESSFVASWPGVREGRDPAAAVAACGNAAIDGNSAAVGQSACDDAFAPAIAIDANSDTVSGIDGAIAACGSLETRVQAAERHPDAFGGQDPAALAGERCASSAALANTAVCNDLPTQ